MALFGKSKFNKTLFNANTQPAASDSALLTEEITSLIVAALEAITLTDTEVNISQPSSDSATLTDTGVIVVPISDSDSMVESDTTVSITVQVLDSGLLSDSTIAITATLSGTDTGALSEVARIIQTAVDSALHSDSTLITIPATDTGTLSSETTQLTFSVSILNATVVTKTALSTAAGIAVRTTPVLSEVASVLFVQEKTAGQTSGTCIMRVAAGIRMMYDVQLADYSWKALGTGSIVADGNIGTAIRVAAGQSVGAQTLKTVTGNLLNLFGLPAQALLIRMTVSCIDKAGTFLIRELATLPVGAGGAVTIGLVSTSDLYVPSGVAVLYEIVQDKPNYPRIGKNAFTVPSGAGPFTFSVSGGSIVVV